MKKFLKKYSNIILIILLMFILFIFIDNIVDKSIIEGSPYNSYELQARAWLNGKTYLDHDYSYLELAIYNNNYYVSFPPFPSVVLLPFAIVFKTIPTNFISFILFVWEFILIYKISKRYKISDSISLLLSCAFTTGTSLLSLSIDSGVWFLAQLLNNLLCILAIDAFLKDKRTLVYLFLALAVGCRPFSAIYMIMFFIYYFIMDKDKINFNKIVKHIKPIVPAMFIAIIYMIYNYIRFDNVFEFGHNYLPEFINATHGQFSFHYLLSNLKNLFIGGISIDNRLHMKFGMPFSCFIANPIIVVYCYHSIKNIIKTKKIDWFRIMIFISIIINIIFICLHRTLGAWQFGARYTCDFLPFIFLAIISYTRKKKTEVNLDKFEIFCILFGVIINVLGTILMYTNKLF